MIKVRISLYSEQRKALERLLRETDPVPEDATAEYAKGFDIVVASVCVGQDQEG